MKIKANIVTCFMLTIFLFYGCATYYQKSIGFHNDFAQGDLESAKKFLEKNKKAEEKKDRLLYFLDRGVVEQMLGNYAESNAYFEKAYLYNLNYRKEFSADVLEMVANPMLKPYKSEDFEEVLLYFYKAINYIHLNELDNALIEVRRVNIRLNELNDQYEDKKNSYKKDAFALNLMGLIYEAKGEINDAFIAYRNAYNAYQQVYESEFMLNTPLQLKKDLLRTSKQLGFRQEYTAYRDSFKIEVDQVPEGNGQLVLFWLNGLGPVKGEYSLNLTAVKGQGGLVTFANEQEGFNLPYNANSGQGGNSTDLKDLKVVRMAIPKYRKRTPVFQEAKLVVDSLKGLEVALEKAEDIERIAFESLKDRMLRELAKSIGRVAIKQAAEEAMRSQNEDLGSLVSIFNGLTEKADTRNWQTLPNSIYYARIDLPPGEHQFKFITTGPNDESQENLIDVQILAGKTSFHSFHSLSSSAPHNFD